MVMYRLHRPLLLFALHCPVHCGIRYCIACRQFYIDTDIWVADSHEAQHDTNENDAGPSWHGQQVFIGADG